MVRLQMNKVDKSQLKEVVASSVAQKKWASFNKSLDPDNFPVFSLSQDEYFFFIPDHRMVDPENPAKKIFRWDRLFLNRVKLNPTDSNDTSVRNSLGIVNESLGLDGTSPLDEVYSIQKELNDLRAKKEADSKGIPVDYNNQKFKDIARAVGDKSLIRTKKAKYTFPIAVCKVQYQKIQSGTGTRKVKAPERDEQGNLIYQIMWYSISEYSYSRTFVKALEQIKNQYENTDEDDKLRALYQEDSFDDIGGLWFHVNFDYPRAEGTDWNPRDAATNFSCNVQATFNKSALSQEDKLKLEEQATKDSEEFDIANSILTVAENQYYPVETLREALAATKLLLESQLMAEQGGASTEAISSGATAGAIESNDSSDGLAIDDID